MGLLLLLVGVRLLPLGVDLRALSGLAEVELRSGPLAELLLVLVEGHHLGFVRFGLGLFLGGRGITSLTNRGGLGSDLVGRSVGLDEKYQLQQCLVWPWWQLKWYHMGLQMGGPEFDARSELGFSLSYLSICVVYLIKSHMEAQQNWFKLPKKNNGGFER